MGAREHRRGTALRAAGRAGATRRGVLRVLDGVRRAAHQQPGRRRAVAAPRGWPGACCDTSCARPAAGAPVARRSRSGARTTPRAAVRGPGLPRRRRAPRLLPAIRAKTRSSCGIAVWRRGLTAPPHDGTQVPRVTVGGTPGAGRLLYRQVRLMNRAGISSGGPQPRQRRRSMADAQLPDQDDVKPCCSGPTTSFRQLVTEHHGPRRTDSPPLQSRLPHRPATVRTDVTQEAEAPAERSHRGHPAPAVSDIAAHAARPALARTLARVDAGPVVRGPGGLASSSQEPCRSIAPPSPLSCWRRCRRSSVRSRAPAAAAALRVLPVAVALFFRDPERRPPADARAGRSSPADGRVMFAGAAAPDERARRGPGSRSPSSCRRSTSTSTARRSRAASRASSTGRARFLPAYRRDARRERAQRDLDRPPTAQTVVVRQVVGILARRIVCRVEDGRRRYRPASGSA